MKNKNESPAIKLLRHVWDHEGGGMPDHSWVRRNFAMRKILNMAIVYGFRFSKGDFDLMSSSESEGGFRFWYWSHEDGEGFYSTACGLNTYGDRNPYGPNISACLSFEAWKKRPPFIIKTERNRSGHRISVGYEFEWNWETVICTSFSEDGAYITACSYEVTKKGELCDECGGYKSSDHKKIKHRYRITLDALREDNKATLGIIKLNENKIRIGAYKGGYGVQDNREEKIWCCGSNGRFRKPDKMEPYPDKAAAVKAALAMLIKNKME